MPTHVAMNIGFAVHYILAAVFMYVLLRAYRVSWTGSVLGGIAYQMSGVIGSYVSPGHDGKLFVTVMLPLAAWALTIAIRDRRWEGYGVFALTVGLALLSPHPQMVQYYLLAAGIFALFLVFNLPADTKPAARAIPLAVALGGVFLGVGIAALQYLPFYAYIPFSPRDEAVVADYVFSTTFSVPWDHVMEFFVPRFSGESFTGSYWGSNGIKLHSEYLGLPVLGLAAVGARSVEHRRLVYWLAGIGVLFLLVSLGGSTPFYRLWWNVVPFVKSTRAPGMALFVVSFVVAMLAAFGTDRVLKGETRAGKWLAIGGGVVALGGIAGVFGTLAANLAEGLEEAGRMGASTLAMRGEDALRMGALIAGLSLAAVGALSWKPRLGALTPMSVALGLIVVVGTDLFLNARTFWNYSDSPTELFGSDQIKDHLKEQPKPLRVMNPDRSLYPGSALMADGIAQWYGHHGNELHAFDVVNGRQGKNLVFSEATNGTLAAMYGINYIVLPTQQLGQDVPGFDRVLDGVPSSQGMPATLLRRTEPEPYARLVRVAIKTTFEQAAATARSAQFPIDHAVVLDETSPVDPGPPPDSLPDPWDITADVTEWVPGAMTIQLSDAAPEDAWLLVAENHYQDWNATVDGNPATLVRGNGSLITVQVPAGGRTVRLDYESPEFSLGVKLAWLSLLITLAACVIPPVMRRRATGRSDG